MKGITLNLFVFIIIVGEYYTLSEGGCTQAPPHTTNTVLKERDIGVSITIRWRETSQGVLDTNRQYKYKVLIKPEYGEQLVSLYK